MTAVPSIAPDTGARRPVRDGLLPFTHRHRPSLARGVLCTVVLVGSRLALPLPLTVMVERTTGSGPRPGLWSGGLHSVALLAAAFVGLALLAGLAEHFQRLAYAHFAGRTVSDARQAALAGPAGCTDPAETGSASAVLADSARVKAGLKGLLNHIILNALLVLGACVALAWADPWLGAVQLVGAVVVVGLGVHGARRVGAVGAQQRDGEAAVAATIHRILMTDQTGRHADRLASLREWDAESARAEVEMTRWEGTTTCAVHLALAVTAAVVLLVGAAAAQNGRMDAATLFTVTAYLLVLHGPCVRLARQITRIGPLLVSARQLGRAVVGPAAAPDA